jgi:short subunit dehydrogenase-like uncharacterized protein
MTGREFDVVVYGATGYTGRLVAEYLAGRARDGLAVRWAMAGRNAQKLAAVRDEIGAPADTPLVLADAADAASIAAMVARTRVVITTVGPYLRYGEPLVAACASAGTDYVDLCGEPPFMRAMIDAYAADAQSSGARIVFSCGFDSVPFDLGVYFLQSEAQRRLGAPLKRVKGRVRSMKGTFSGGTLASLHATMEAARRDPDVLALLQTPWALTPGFEGPPQPTGNEVEEDPAVGSWVTPFVMAPINTRNIHRSNLLLGHRWGSDFVYDEMLMTGPGERGRQAAEAMAAGSMMDTGPDGPKPGEGPTPEERRAGSYDLLFVGEDDQGVRLRVAVTGDRDPGYGSTSKIITECALCLLDEAAGLAGGIYTPAPAFGMAIIERLRAHAGLTFEVEH